jgi:hypothetical protein
VFTKKKEKEKEEGMCVTWDGGHFGKKKPIVIMCKSCDHCSVCQNSFD